MIWKISGHSNDVKSGVLVLEVHGDEKLVGVVSIINVETFNWRMRF